MLYSVVHNNESKVLYITTLYAVTEFLITYCSVCSNHFSPNSLISFFHCEGIFWHFLNGKWFIIQITDTPKIYKNSIFWYFWPRAYTAEAVLNFGMLFLKICRTIVKNKRYLARFKTNVPFCLKNKGNGLRFSCCPGGLAALAALLPWRPCCPN